MREIMGKKLIHGVGVNDANYVTQVKVCTGEKYPKGSNRQVLIWVCPFYLKWKDMLTRCYSGKYHLSRPTYKDCTVCEDWLLFSDFRKWMVVQNWKDKHLDKDILVEDNKIYSPTTCIFVFKKVNTFIGDRAAARGKYLIGSTLPKGKSRFSSQCNNPFKDKGDPRKYHIGYFNTEIEAHLAWKKRKHEYACALANSEYVTDERVRQVLKNKYKNYIIVEDHIK